MWFFPFYCSLVFCPYSLLPLSLTSIYLYICIFRPCLFIFFPFLLSFPFSFSLSPLWRCSHGAPQGWAQCTDKQSTHGDPGHPSQNKQQEDVYLCPFHWPWPLLPVRGPALSIATTLLLFLGSGRVALLKTCSKLSHHTEIHVPYLRMRCLAFLISILHSQICYNHENCITVVFSECQNLPLFIQ